MRNSKKAEELKRTVNDENLIVELVPDMLVENAFDELFKKYNTQIKYVFHTASPVLETSKDYEKSLIEPAITGAKSMVEAIRKYSLTSVEHIVYTSSIAARSLESEFTDPLPPMRIVPYEKAIADEVVQILRVGAYYG